MRHVLIDLAFSPRPRSTSFGAGLVALLARIVFASVLLRFFLSSFLTKIDGFGLSAGAYMQILPKKMEAVGYDPSQVALPFHMVVLGGTLAELILPMLVVLGLATRPAALAMIGFIVVMSLTDIFGHGIDAQTIGQPFDRDPSGLVLDQRMMWVFVLCIPAWLGGGGLSLDALLWPRLRSDTGATTETRQDYRLSGSGKAVCLDPSKSTNDLQMVRGGKWKQGAGTKRRLPMRWPPVIARPLNSFFGVTTPR